MIAKKNKPQQQTPRFRLNKKYFNYSKKSYYIKNYLGCINLKRNPEDKKIKNIYIYI